MKFVLPIIFTAFICAPALAYNDGRYICKNVVKGLPDNVYDIKSVAAGVGSATLPYIEVVRHFRKVPNDQNSEILRATVRGFGTVFDSEGSNEMLAIGALKLEFVNDELAGCIR